MGSGLSKHEDEIRADAAAAAREAARAKRRAESLASVSATANGEQSSGDSAQTESRCPMRRADGTYRFDFSAMFSGGFPHHPGGDHPISEKEAREKTKQPTASSQSTDRAAPSGGGCPVKHQEYNVYSQPIDPKNNMPRVANQLPAPGQTKELSTERVVSSIPKGGASEEGSKWTYPSPQMFYNALARKGKLEDTDEQEIANVVAMHNNMNEKTWSKVLEWEEATAATGDDTDPPKLLKFQGRPTDLSPKAAFKYYLFGHPLPYDRHDWTVLRHDGTTVRYVIDYYYDESRASDDAASAMPDLKDVNATPSLLVDVRPALDGPSQAWDRFVAMPYARRIAQTTPFHPLPLSPSPDMKSQIGESVQVWQNIQAAVAGKGKADSSDKSFALSKRHPTLLPEIDETQAKDLAAVFSKARVSCRDAAQRVDECVSDSACAKASMGLTMCMGKLICPLQHGTLVKTLSNDTSDDEKIQEAKIETAMANLSECVSLKSRQHAAAKKEYPQLFAKK